MKTQTLVDVLHIEDEKSIRDLVETIAEDEGLSYAGFGFIRDAALALKDGLTARLYFVDGNIPFREGENANLNAGKAMSSIRKADPNANIVLMTSYDRQDVEEIIEKYNTGYLQKPFAIEPILNYFKEIKE